MDSSEMILQTVFILAACITMLTLHWRGVAMKVLHVTRHCVSMDELEADGALDFIGI
jgi:hypothetical protein